MTTPAPGGPGSDAAVMPDIAATLLEIIVCPVDHGDLTLSASPAGGDLTCATCGLVYPVRDSIPVLLVDEARRPG